MFIKTLLEDIGINRGLNKEIKRKEREKKGRDRSE